MVDYGSGIDLDSYFDINPGPTGDTVSVSGIDEVLKDLSYNLSGALRYGIGVDSPQSMSNGVVGQVVEDGVSEDIAIVVADIIEDDPRVDNVSSVDVEQPDVERLEIGVRATLAGGESEFTEFIVTGD